MVCSDAMLNRCATLFGLKHSNEELPWAFCEFCFAVASKCFPVCLLLLPGVPYSSSPVSRPRIFFSPLEVWFARSRRHCDVGPTRSCGTFPLRFFCAFESCQNVVDCFTGFVLSTRPTRVSFFRNGCRREFDSDCRHVRHSDWPVRG